MSVFKDVPGWWFHPETSHRVAGDHDSPGMETQNALPLEAIAHLQGHGEEK